MDVLRDLKKRRLLDSIDLPELPKKAKPVKILFEDFASEYLSYSLYNKTPKTHKGELERINAHWLPYFQGRCLHEITKSDIEAWKQLRLSEGKSSHTLQTELKILKCMFGYAKEMDYFKGDDPVGKLPKTIKRQIKFLTPEEAEKYLQACAPSFFPLAATLLFTGMRVGELFELKWTDVNLDSHTIIARPETTKSKKERVIPISDQIHEILANLPRTSDYVFPGEDGKSQRKTCQHAHEKARRKAGLMDFRIHDLRHTFISLAVRQGYDLATISRIVGHSSTKITYEIYTHIYPDHALNVVNGLPIDLGKIKNRVVAKP
jgi:integrase